MSGINMTAAQAIVECLKLENIDKVFCVPGESYLPLLDALYDETTIEVISARHEGGAAFMAEGYAKATLKPGVVMATRGVGAANLSIGVHTAFQDSTPMIVLLGQVHTQFRGREGFQEVDLDRFFQPISKWAVEVDQPERMPEIIQRAIRISMSGRPGPVIISLPEDVLPKYADMTFGPAFQKSRPSPSQNEIHRLKELLKKAKRPIIIAGGGVKLSEAEAELQTFAEKFSIPVLSAFRRHDVFPNDHPLYGGHLGLGTDQRILQSVKEADVIIAIGTRLSEVTTQDYTIIKPDQTFIHVDIESDVIGKSIQPHLGIVADAKESLLQFSTLDIGDKWHDWAKSCHEQFTRASQLVLGESATIYHYVMDDLINNLQSNSIITNDAGNFAGWLHTYYLFKEKHTYIGPTSGAMGYGLPAAIGAQLSTNERRVISLSGDGGFMMTFQELETAVRYKIPVIAIVFNNQMYGTIRMHQEIHYPKRVIATDLGEVSFKGLAESVGAIGYTVTNYEDFKTALSTSLNNLDKPSVIEIVVDKEQISVSKTLSSLLQSDKQ